MSAEKICDSIDYDISSKSGKLYEFDKWMSNDNLKLVKITKSSNDIVEYSESGRIKKIGSDEFLDNFKPVDLDTSLHNGIPNAYMGNEPIWF
jgi:hypothetical protein